MKPCKTADYFIIVDVCVVVDRKILTDFRKTVETGIDLRLFCMYKLGLSCRDFNLKEANFAIFS